MYKALNYWVFGGFAGEKTPYEFIDWAAQKGLDGIELTVGDVLNIDITKEECLKIAEYAKSKNVGLKTLASGAGWGCYLGTDNEVERTAAVEFCKKYLYIASYLGAESILVVPGATRVAWDDSRPQLSYKTVWEKTVQSVKELIPLAEELKVNIALENVWNRFLFSPMEWKLFLDQFNSKFVGIYFDLGNAKISCNPEHYPEILGDYIKAVHVKNFAETDCAGGLHGFGDDLTCGDVDFAACFNALKNINYNGPFTVEMIPFSRLPDLVLPDLDLANKVTEQFLAM